MTSELSSHCLCDKCGSDECQVGKDSTEYLIRKKAFDEVLSVLASIKHQEEDIWLFETIAKKIKELRPEGKP